MPPPTTSMRFGMLLSSSAPVESTTRSSSGMKGSFTACEPAAMMALANLTTFFAAARERDLDVVRVEEAADPRHDLDLARLGHAGEAAGELLDHAVLEAAQRVDVDFGRART